MPTLSRRVPAIVSSILLTLGVGLMVLGVVLMDAREALLTPEGLARRAGAALADPRATADDDKQAQMSAPRLAMRTYLATDYVREVTLRPAK